MEKKSKWYKEREKRKREKRIWKKENEEGEKIRKKDNEVIKNNKQKM